MKYIKLLSIIALLGVFASCEKNFEPAIGNTAVEFVNTEVTVDLLGSYHYIPVQMVEQSDLAAKATISFTGGIVEFKNGTKREVLEFTNDEEGYNNGGDIIITSKTINVGAYDAEVDGEGLPTNSFEILIPAYKDIKNIELNFELTGDNVAANSTTKYVAKVSEDVLLGTWSIACVDGSVMPVVVAKQTGSSYAVSFGSFTWTGTRSGNVLTMEIEGPEYNGNALYLCECSAEGSVNTAGQVVLTFAEDGNSFTCDTGAVVFYIDGESLMLVEYYWIVPGEVGTKN